VYDAQEAGSVAEYYCMQRWGVSRAELLAGKQIDKEQQLTIHQDMKRLLAAEPVQYVIGHIWFADLKLQVNPSALIPRPETEELLYLMVRDAGPMQVLVDWCTGSGCLALGLKHHNPSAHVFGLDSSDAALTLAKQNAIQTGLEVEWLLADVKKEPWPDLPLIDLLVANPPYVLQQEALQMHSNVLRYEPHMALFVEEKDPLVYYRALLKGIKSRASASCRAWFEINPLFVEELASLAKVYGFESVSVLQDSYGKERFLRVSDPIS
jgi:release factor glutamine methyltransferase